MSMISKDDLRLSSDKDLERIGKQQCLGCQKNRMYYCYDCRTIMPGVFTPTIKLPCDVDIVKHPMEKNSKSSALACKIVASGQTRVFDHPDVFDYREEPQGDDHGGSTVLLFPSPTALPIEEFVKKHGKIKRFVVLDCTWFQVKVMQRTPEIQGLPCVILKDYKTTFWRPQHNVNERHLATIEAIYYAQMEYNDLAEEKLSKGSFDDLLFWYFFTRDKVDARALERENSWTRSADLQLPKTTLPAIVSDPS